jgi:hypothetical protein
MFSPLWVFDSRCDRGRRQTLQQPDLGQDGLRSVLMARNQPIHQIVDHLLAVLVDRCEFNAVAIAFS